MLKRHNYGILSISVLDTNMAVMGQEKKVWGVSEILNIDMTGYQFFNYTVFIKEGQM